MSRIFGVCIPATKFHRTRTPDLAQAARKTLIVRGDDGVGWSLAYKAALWARLGDGNHAWLLVRKALAPGHGRKFVTTTAAAFIPIV